MGKKESFLDRQLSQIKSKEMTYIPNINFLENKSDSNSSDGVSLSPDDRSKYARLMYSNVQVDQLKAMNDYLSGIKKQVQQLNEVVAEQNIIAHMQHGNADEND